MRIIIDCNIWISLLIGHRVQLIRKIILDSRFDVYVCDDLLNEIRDVANRSKIRKYISTAECEDLFRIIQSFCILADINLKSCANIRDPKDLYLLSFAESITADYIISGDNDLLTLKQHRNTKIIKLAEFFENCQL